MALIARPWSEVTDGELLAEGNRPIRITKRRHDPETGIPVLDVEEVMACGWFENPETHTLSLRRRVRVTEVDEVMLVEFALLNADEWVGVENTYYLYDPEGMAEQKRQAEQQRQMEAAMTAGAPGPNREQRRAIQSSPAGPKRLVLPPS